MYSMEVKKNQKIFTYKLFFKVHFSLAVSLLCSFCVVIFHRFFFPVLLNNDTVMDMLQTQRLSLSLW